jgi:hypothetical protein
MDEFDHGVLLLRGASRLGELTPLAGLVDDIPTAFEKLRDDPYRSLAGEVRDAGGFAKSDAPFHS